MIVLLSILLAISVIANVVLALSLKYSTKELDWYDRFH